MRSPRLLMFGKANKNPSHLQSHSIRARFSLSSSARTAQSRLLSGGESGSRGTTLATQQVNHDQVGLPIAEEWSIAKGDPSSSSGHLPLRLELPTGEVVGGLRTRGVAPPRSWNDAAEGGAGPSTGLRDFSPQAIPPSVRKPLHSRCRLAQFGQTPDSEHLIKHSVVYLRPFPIKGQGSNKTNRLPCAMSQLLSLHVNE
jgi:hypothetical protein